MLHYLWSRKWLIKAYVCYFIDPFSWKSFLSISLFNYLQAIEQSKRYDGLATHSKNISGQQDLTNFARNTPVTANLLRIPKKGFAPPQPPVGEGEEALEYNVSFPLRDHLQPYAFSGENYLNMSEGLGAFSMAQKFLDTLEKFFKHTKCFMLLMTSLPSGIKVTLHSTLTCLIFPGQFTSNLQEWTHHWAWSVTPNTTVIGSVTKRGARFRSPNTAITGKNDDRVVLQPTIMVVGLLLQQIGNGKFSKRHFAFARPISIYVFRRQAQLFSINDQFQFSHSFFVLGFNWCPS